MALRTIRLFISSPGDVAEERLIARRLIGRMDARFGGALQFEAMLWERAPLLATASFQEQLVKPSDTDVVVMILWSRLGTPLPAAIVRPDGTTYASGTEFEFEDAIAGFRRAGHPHILTYLKTAPITPSGDLASLEEAAEQKRALERFVTKWFRNADDGTLTGAFHNFAAPADFEDLLEAHLTQLAEQFVPKGVAMRASAPTWLGRSPFRGLQVFEPEHAPVFFGRTAATATVLAKLRAQGQAGRAFVLIVSMSGSGKSSLMRAGVLPLLMQPGVVGTATQWRHAVLRPADGQGRLVDALWRTILQATAADGDAAAEEPGADDGPLTADGLVTRTGERLGRLTVAAGPALPDATIDAETKVPACHLALFVDQLEEIYSDERVAASERDVFFEALAALAHCGVVWILATMRSDSYFRIAESPTLVALKEGEGQFDLLPPNVREIGQIIRMPAAAAGLRFETRPNTAEKLDDVIRDAAARNPAALPLLQFLLEELYQRRNAEDVLTFGAYEELGRVEGALAQQAEKVLARLSNEARGSLSTVLRELVTFAADDDSRALRRVAPRSAFVTPAANELVDAMLQARLLVSGSGTDGAAVISVAHEALLEFWPRMKVWIEEDRELLAMHARLQTAAREWERNGRRTDLVLPRGKPLSEARELAAAGIRLSEPERALLDVSQRRARRFAVVRASAVAALASLSIVAGLAAWRAQLESRRAQTQATTALRTTDFMVGLFAQADPDQSKGDKVTVREVLDRGVTQINKDLVGESSVRANLLRAMGQAYTGLGLFPTGRTALEAAVSASELSDDPQSLTKARLALADNDYQDGRYSEAVALYRLVLSNAENHGSPNSVIALAKSGLAEALSDDNQPEEAEILFRAALSLNSMLPSGNLLEAARDLDGLGKLLFTQARGREGIPLMEQSLAIKRRLLGSNDSSVALSLNNLGALYYQVGELDKAVAEYDEALPIYRRVFGPDHPRVAILLNNLGRVELLSNRLTPARVHLDETITILRKAMDESHDEFILPLNNLAMVEIEQGDYAKARDALGQALQIAQERKHWALNQILGNLAEVNAREGNCKESGTYLAQADDVLRRLYSSTKLATTENWRVAVLDLTRASCAIPGDPELAERLVSDSLPFLNKHFGKGSIYDIDAARISAKISRIRG